MSDTTQRSITYGQSVNLASDYVLNAFPPGELSFADYSKLVDDYASELYHQIITNQNKIQGVNGRGREASVQSPPQAPLSAATGPPPPDYPPPENYEETVSDGIVDGRSPGFQFDYEVGAVWQRNDEVSCPQCNFPSQKWDRDWMRRPINAKGNRGPAYRCGSFTYDETKRGAPLWGWVSSTGCSWVDWRSIDEYPI